MPEGLTHDEMEDFYGESIPVKIGKIKPATIKVDVENKTDFVQPVAIKIKNQATTSEVDTANIDNLADTIISMEIPSETIPITLSVEKESTRKNADNAKKEESRSYQRGVGRIWLRRLGTICTVLVAIFALALVGLRIAGFRTFTVMSGSMEPEYPVGSLIYVKPVDYKSLKVGDVISFVANNDKTVVTHRIAEIKVDENDPEVWRFKTKGDGNNTADAQLVHYKNVIGTPIIRIPYIGYLAHNIQQPPGIYIALVVGTLLLAWTFLPGTLEGRRRTARNTAL